MTTAEAVQEADRESFREFTRETDQETARETGQPREALLVGARAHGPIVAALRDAGWCPRSVQQPHEIRRHAAQADLQVGLVDLARADVDIAKITDLLCCGGQRLAWIAVASAENLERDDVRAIVARHCQSVERLPLRPGRLKLLLDNARDMAELRLQIDPLGAGQAPACGIVGVSVASTRLRESVARFASSDAPVLITGERGSGKELTARALHSLSTRNAGPFIAVDCSRDPNALPGTELVSHRRGTNGEPLGGAERHAVSLLTAANGGTVFLDEVTELPPAVQSSLARLLQAHRAGRHGSQQASLPDVRIVAASKQDLELAVAQGRLRGDLHEQLDVLRLRMPPLRERAEDTERLAWSVFHRHARERRPFVRGFSQEALAAMRLHDWPGNVRELINRVRRALITCDEVLIGPRDLGITIDPDRSDDTTTLDFARTRAEQAALRRMLLMTGGNVSEAARRLGISRATLYRLLAKYAVEPCRHASNTAATAASNQPTGKAHQPTACVR